MKKDKEVRRTCWDQSTLLEQRLLVKSFDHSAEIPHRSVETWIRPGIRHRFQSGIRVEGGQEPGGEYFGGIFLKRG
jgi:hypothetical protein